MVCEGRFANQQMVKHRPKGVEVRTEVNVIVPKVQEHRGCVAIDWPPCRTIQKFESGKVVRVVDAGSVVEVTELHLDMICRDVGGLVLDV